MSLYSDLLGTIKQAFSVGIRGVVLKNKAGTSAGSEVLQVRNALDSAFSSVEVGGVTAAAVGATSVTTTAGVTVGNTLTVSAGGASVTGDVSSTGTVTGATGVTATTGNVTATAGNVTAGGSITAGTGLTVTTGNLQVSSGNIELTGDLVVDPGANAVTISGPAAGGPTTLTLPQGAGVSGYVLSTNGAGVLSWVDPGDPAAGAARWSAASTSVAFNSSATIAGDSIPQDSVIDSVQVIIDTPFDATGVLLSVGITGSPTKYMLTTDNALNFGASTVFTVHPGLPAEGAATAIELGFTAGTGGTAGAARVIVTYAAPL